MSANSYWWITLALGFVVLLVALLLLHLFLKQVHRIEAGADQIWATGKQVARNTATTWMLGETSRRLDALTEEALRHDAFLRGGENGPGELA